MEHTVIQVIATMMVFLTLSFKPVSSEVDITRTGCGKTKFCLEEPEGCDPAGNGTCLFGSVKPTAINIPNGVDMAFELSGNSSGYIAIGLITNNSELFNFLFFFCGKNNSDSGSFFFGSSITNQSSTKEEPMETTVTGNSTDGVNIKCTFTVAKLNASKISSAGTTENITYSVVIWSRNVENDTLTSFPPGKQSMAIDLATFLSNSPTTSSTTSPTNSPTTSSTTSTTNSPTNTTAAPNGANRPVFSDAVLPLLSFLTLFLLKFA